MLESVGSSVIVFDVRYLYTMSAQRQKGSVRREGCLHSNESQPVSGEVGMF
jgi:hypothetical protein